MQPYSPGLFDSNNTFNDLTRNSWASSAGNFGKRHDWCWAAWIYMPPQYEWSEALIRLIIVLSRYLYWYAQHDYGLSMHFGGIFRDLCHFQNFGCIISRGLVREVSSAQGVCIPFGCRRAHICLLHAQEGSHVLAAPWSRIPAVKWTKKFWLGWANLGPGVRRVITGQLTHLHIAITILFQTPKLKRCVQIGFERGPLIGKRFDHVMLHGLEFINSKSRRNFWLCDYQVLRIIFWIIKQVYK